MARIRSIHPGQWTDEEFASLSFGARLLAIAIRCEADDRGCFEWKPMRLKMRLFPADNVDVAELLTELEAANQIMRYEADGKSYGAIRNFLKYQRPQRPSYFCPAPPPAVEYVTGGALNSNINPQPFAEESASDHGAIMERSAKVSAEGRKVRREEGKKVEERTPLPPIDLQTSADIARRVVDVVGVDLSKDISGRWSGAGPAAEVEMWLGYGLTEGDIIAEARASPKPDAKTLRYWRPQMQRLAETKAAPVKGRAKIGEPGSGLDLSWMQDAPPQQGATEGR